MDDAIQTDSYMEFYRGDCLYHGDLKQTANKTGNNEGPCIRLNLQ